MAPPLGIHIAVAVALEPLAERVGVTPALFGVGERLKLAAIRDRLNSRGSLAGRSAAVGNGTQVCGLVERGLGLLDFLGHGLRASHQGVKLALATGLGLNSVGFLAFIGRSISLRVGNQLFDLKSEPLSLC